jgi:RNA polymerase sigma factor (sigma-70 family)
MIGAMGSDEALAMCRLRQWANDKLKLKYSRTSNYEHEGWQARRLNEQDGRLIRVIDFDLALQKLRPDERAALILRYRDKAGYEEIAVALSCSARKVSYMIPQARQHLADVLDRMDLL